MNTQLLYTHLVDSLSSLAVAASKNNRSTHTDDVVLRALLDSRKADFTILESISEINAERDLIGVNVSPLVGDLNSRYGTPCSSEDLLILEELQVIALSQQEQHEKNPRMMDFIYRILRNLGRPDNAQKDQMIEEVKIVANLTKKAP